MKLGAQPERRRRNRQPRKAESVDLRDTEHQGVVSLFVRANLATEFRGALQCLSVQTHLVLSLPSKL